MTYTIHIAAAPEPQVQRCARCAAVLIDARGAMSLDGSGMRAYPAGGFVGVTDACSIQMDRDARDADEVRCDRATI